MTLLAKRYAAALFALAEQKGALDQVAQDLAALHTELSVAAVRELLTSPDVAADERTRLLSKLTQGRHQLVQNTVGVLRERHRLAVLADLPAAFRSLWMAHRGEVEGVAESAHPLDDQQMQNLAELASRLSGKRVVLTGRVRPDLLGGVRLIVGNVLYDGSLRAALQQLEQRLLQSNV